MRPQETTSDAELQASPFFACGLPVLGLKFAAFREAVPVSGFSKKGHAMKTKNPKLLQWVEEIAALCKPDAIHWCDGSQAEYDAMIKVMVAAGAATPLPKRPNS